ncbi:colicin immunity domain-containing protein [Massilia endophytica]|uniref:colicin immunity domain-containing protein n=1 Tax=Massilia endophytica TaxID=2899220 RepID=UPI001E41E10E|nr:colicin immunity domain-containing protein [Massilia endophytica]UGQ45466.1 colicin immunity domain-containing protein [Massilia endophytica]
MTSILESYWQLMLQYLDGKMSTEGFQDAFIGRFKKEKRAMNETEYALLDELFGDADAWSGDPVLRAEMPDFYLDEAALRKQVASAAERIGKLLP